MAIKKKALITGVTGQDGSYLAELLLSKGYEVHGVKRRSSSFNTERINHIYQDPHNEIRDFYLHYGDMTDSTNLIRIVSEVQPDEIYNLAAQSHVQVSFETAEYTSNADGIGAVRLLEAIRLLNLESKTKFYQASTSEMFGLAENDLPLNEKSRFYPRSPYGAAKLYAHWITVNYREAYKIFASSGILFNHESPRRGETFVTRKITRAAAKIALGMQDCLYLGNLNAQRDWGHAKDYIEGMYLILQQEKPEDFVLATGITTTIRDFVKMSFAELGIELAFRGKDESEEGYIVKNNSEYKLEEGKVVVKVDPKYYRPTEVDLLIGDPTKAMTKLGWKPKYDLASLVKEMVASDVSLFKKELYIKQSGL
mgnify:CR=1 FL=1